MTDEVKEYFNQRYKESKVKVVPGHWPDFKTKADVDEWLDVINKLFGAAFKKSHTCPQCQNEEIKPEHNFCKICGLKLQEHATL